MSRIIRNEASANVGLHIGAQTANVAPAMPLYNRPRHLPPAPRAHLSRDVTALDLLTAVAGLGAWFAALGAL